MLRYLRLYAYFVRFSISRALEFRFDFFFRVVMDCVFYAVNICFFKLLYGHVGEFAGLEEHEAMVFVAAYIFVDAVHMTLFSNNTWWLPTYINRGDVDYYLVRPVSSLFFLSLRDFATNSFINLLISIGILIWAFSQVPEPLGAGAITLFLGLLLVGEFINYCLIMLFLTPVFWTHSAHGLKFLYFSTHELTERPHTMFPTWLQRVLLSLFPSALVASLPTFVLFDGMTAMNALNFVLVPVCMFLLLLFVWSRGLRVYSSASS